MVDIKISEPDIHILHEIMVDVVQDMESYDYDSQKRLFKYRLLTANKVLKKLNYLINYKLPRIKKKPPGIVIGKNDKPQQKQHAKI